MHAQCWAHNRRYYYQAVPLDKDKEMNISSLEYKGVDYCDKLFEIERQIADFDLPEKLEARQKLSKPIVEEFFNWVNITLETKIITNKKCSEALNYSKNQQKELSEFLNDSRIPLDNSRCERAIRPFAVHRKRMVICGYNCWSRSQWCHVLFSRIC